MYLHNGAEIGGIFVHIHKETDFWKSLGKFGNMQMTFKIDRANFECGQQRGVSRLLKCVIN